MLWSVPLIVIYSLLYHRS